MFCVKVKEFLSQKGIPFTERDISQYEEALDDLDKMEVFSTPVTVIDGEVVVGFDRRKLDQLLEG